MQFLSAYYSTVVSLWTWVSKQIASSLSFITLINRKLILVFRIIEGHMYLVLLVQPVALNITLVQILNLYSK